MPFLCAKRVLSCTVSSTASPGTASCYRACERTSINEWQRLLHASRAPHVAPNLLPTRLTQTGLNAGVFFPCPCACLPVQSRFVRRRAAGEARGGGSANRRGAPPKRGQCLFPRRRPIGFLPSATSARNGSCARVRHVRHARRRWVLPARLFSTSTHGPVAIQATVRRGTRASLPRRPVMRRGAAASPLFTVWTRGTAQRPNVRAAD